MSEERATSPLTRLRETMRVGADAARQATEAARRRDDVMGVGVRVGAAGAGAVRRGAAVVGRKANQGVTRAAKNLTLGEYRDEVDAALVEATEVIAAQTVRIAALEDRLRDLELEAGPAAAPDSGPGDAGGV